ELSIKKRNNKIEELNKGLIKQRVGLKINLEEKKFGLKREINEYKGEIQLREQINEFISRKKSITISEIRSFVNKKEISNSLTNYPQSILFSISNKFDIPPAVGQKRAFANNIKQFINDKEDPLTKTDIIQFIENQNIPEEFKEELTTFKNEILKS